MGLFSSILLSVIRLSRLIHVKIELHVRPINKGKKSSSNETQFEDKESVMKMSQSETALKNGEGD